MLCDNVFENVRTELPCYVMYNSTCDEPIYNHEETKSEIERYLVDSDET